MTVKSLLHLLATVWFVVAALTLPHPDEQFPLWARDIARTALYGFAILAADGIDLRSIAGMFDRWDVRP